MTPPAPAARTQPLQRSVVSRLLSGGPGVDSAARQRLLVTIAGRQAVLVELSLPPGAIPDDVRSQFGDVFQTAFAGQSSQPPVPIPISGHYLRCLLTQDEITALARQDAGRAAATPPLPRTIYRIWPDYRVRAHIDRSCATIQADAASRTYGVSGAGVVWAVVDSGIDATHPHFAGGTVTDPVVARLHRDFTGLLQPAGIVSQDPAPALTDALGHGTHVAGIIAGQAPDDPARLVIATNEPSTDDLPAWATRGLDPGRSLQGMAPRARLVSLKVLDDSGDTVSSAVIAALAQVRAFNAGGSQLQIHGVNLSIGCDWFPDEFAAGQSPLCRELDLLVGTGVVAVVSAGNSGSGGTLSGGSGDVHGRLSTITDPGNSVHAITVGSTHRSAPHLWCHLYLVEGPNPRRTAQARSGCPWRAHHVGSDGRARRCRTAAAGRRSRRRALRRGQRHVHGCPARFRRDRRVPVSQGRVHGPARGGQEDVPGQRDVPGPARVLSGRRSA